MKKMVLSALLVVTTGIVFAQKQTLSVEDPSKIQKFLSDATGLKNLIGCYSRIISKDSVILAHLAYYDKGKQVLLYGKQVDSLLIARNCREKIYRDLKRYVNQ